MVVIMKAIDYIELYRKVRAESGDSEAIVECALKLGHEISTLTVSRNAKTDSAFIAILTEMKNKWRAVVARDPSISDATFGIAVYGTMPEVYDLLLRKGIIADYLGKEPLK